LVAKLIAWVGKYLRTFAQLPLHKETTPYSLTHLWKQLIIPKYLFTLPVYGLSLSFGLFYWVWSKSLTLSIGAARVFAMAPEVPPRIKSLITLEALLLWSPDDVDDPPCIFINKLKRKYNQKIIKRFV
jgi:hypothetical protein